MKYALCSILLALPLLSQAQFIRDEPKEDVKAKTQLMNISSINGLLVGYAFYCQQPEAKIQVMHDYFYDMVSKLKDTSMMDGLKKNYEEKVTMGREKGPTFSGTDCTKLTEEYTKILSTIESEKKK